MKYLCLVGGRDLASTYRLYPLQDLIPNSEGKLRPIEWILNKIAECPNRVNGNLENNKRDSEYLKRQADWREE